MKAILLAIAWIALALGVVGVFVPVLPTTPLVLLAAFLFGKSSPRMQAWIATTRVYRAYVEPFKRSGGITKRKKLHIIGISYLVLALSAVLVQRPVVWAILGAVALFLAWLMLFKIPTVATSDLAKVADPELGARIVAELHDDTAEEIVHRTTFDNEVEQT